MSEDNNSKFEAGLNNVADSQSGSDNHSSTASPDNPIEKVSTRRTTILEGKSWFSRLLVILGHVSDTFAVIGFVLMTIMILITIVMRWIKIPFSIGDEATRYLMVSSLMLGIRIGVRENSHQGVEGVVQRFPEKIRRITQISINWFTTITYFFLAYLSYQFAIQTKSFGQTSPALDLPMSLLYYIVCVGFALAALENILLFYRIFIEKSIGFFEGEEAGAL